MYQQSKESNDKYLLPNNSKVRNNMVANKQDWQYNLSARVLQYASSDLEKAWKDSLTTYLVDQSLRARRITNPLLLLIEQRLKMVSWSWISQEVLTKLNGTQLNLLIKLDIRAISNYV